MRRLILLVEVGPRPLTIETAELLPAAYDGVAYSVVLEGSGGSRPYRWEHSGGTFPSGLALDAATGEISGTPSGSGLLFLFTVRLSDAFGVSTEKEFQLLYNAYEAPAPLTILSTSPLPRATPEDFYSFVFQATGGTPPYEWQISGGTPPPNMTLDGTGELYGTESNYPEVYTFTVEVRDAADPVATAEGEFTLAVDLP
jgi:hypothetical protein